MTPRPFRIEVPDAALADLRDRFVRVRWPDEAPGPAWSYGTSLTAVMLYWVTGAINSSFWPYYWSRHAFWSSSPAEPIRVPVGFADFPAELLRPPRSWAERVCEVRRWTAMPAGGHFAALEEPEALAADLRAFFREVR